jgi:hypothetical protein
VSAAHLTHVSHVLRIAAGKLVEIRGKD